MIEKELRALVPLWFASAALLAASPGVYPLNNLAVPLYFISVSALGAFSIGHEYSYGTLGFALALPVPRRRIWLTKLGVLLPLLASLALLAAWRVELDRGDRTFGTAIFWLPALAAFFIAPWLTVLSRSPLAGTVFTIGVIGGSMTLGEWIGIAGLGFTREVDGLRIAFMWWSLALLSVAGAVMGWRAFSRLEVADARGTDLQLQLAPTGRIVSTGRVRRHPLAALVRKELRLQQLTLVLAAMYAAVCLGTALSRAGDTAFALASIFSALYTMVMPAVIGSLAGAEERQFGTHDAQLLLPVKTSHQWVVKTVAALSMTFLVAVALPFALTRLFPAEPVRGFAASKLSTQGTIQALAVASVSLYVSTLARNSLNALVPSILAIVGLGYFTLGVGLRLVENAFRLVRAARHYPPEGRLSSVNDAVWFLLLAGFVILVLRLALSNYRYDDRSPRRVALHTVTVLGAIAVGAVTLGVIRAL